jgi:hypothetical protein
MALPADRRDCIDCPSTRIPARRASCPGCGSPPDRARRRRGWARTVLLVVVVAVCLLAAAVAAAMMRVRHQRNEVLPAVVQELTWRRNISAPVLKTWQEESWVVPGSGVVLREERRVIRHERRIVRTDTVWRQIPRYENVRVGTDTVRRTVEERVPVAEAPTCGSRDRGNGTLEDVACAEAVPKTRTRVVEELRPRYEQWATGMERRMQLVPVQADVPVYGTWYTYSISVLDTVHLVTSGPRGEAPRWPAIPPDTIGPVTRMETYTIVLRDARGREYSHWVKPEEWSSSPLRPGQRVALRQGSGLWPDILPRDSLPACRRWHAGDDAPPPDTLGCTPLPADAPAP